MSDVRAVLADVVARARAVTVSTAPGEIVTYYGRGQKRRGYPWNGRITTYRASTGATMRVGGTGNDGGGYQIQAPINAADSRDAAALVVRALQDYYVVTIPVEFRANIMPILRDMHDKRMIILREVRERDGSFEIHRPSAAMPAPPRVTDSPAFRAWFGASRVVTPTGDPLVVYHGSRASFEAFSEAARGTATGAPSAGEGFFFSRRPNTAGSYTYMVLPHEKIAYDALRKAKQYAEASEMIRAGGNVTPVFLRIENPLVVDQKGKGYRETSYFDLIQRARAAGHDGLVIKNTYDAVLGDALPDDVYVIFDPRQAKSVFNRGTWSRTSPVLLDGLRWGRR